MIKLEQEFVRKEFKRRGYFLLDEYKNNQTPLKCKKDGYYVKLSYANLTYNKIPSPFRIDDNEFLFHNIKNFIFNINPDIKVIQYTIINQNSNKRILVTLECECGTIYEKTIDKLQSKKNNIKCLNCNIKERSMKRRIPTRENISLLENFGYTVLNSSESFIRNEKILVKDKQGYKGYTTCNKVLQGKHFEIFNIKTNKDNYIYNINVYALNNGINVTALGFSIKDKWTRQGILFRCECGNTFETSVASFQNGKTRCDECSNINSKWSRKVEDFLIEKDILYIKEFRIDTCRDILPLPFDYFLSDYNQIIEVDGEGHERVCRFNGIEYDKAEKTYLLTRKHDDIKNKYCEKYGIPLLRISYKNIISEQYKTQIMQFIKA